MAIKMMQSVGTILLFFILAHAISANDSVVEETNQSHDGNDNSQHPSIRADSYAFVRSSDAAAAAAAAAAAVIENQRKESAFEVGDFKKIADRMRDSSSPSRLTIESQTTVTKLTKIPTFSPGNTIRENKYSSDGIHSSSERNVNENDAPEVGEDESFECGSPENLHKGSFSSYDYVIVCGMLVISLGIGVFYGFFHKSGGSSNEFLLGSEMSIFPVTLSLTTSFITAIELLGNPAEVYYNGTQFSLIVIPMVLVIPVAIKIFYPIYYKLELTSCYEYLGIRFGKQIRTLGGFLYIIQMAFYTAVAVLAPAIALSKATGLNTRLAVVLIYVVCIFYASQGGMKAVVIADTFQACVLAVSLVLIVALGYFYTGGFDKVFETASKADRIELWNFDPNPTTRHTVWSIVIGGFFYWTSLFCTNQASVQKCMSLKSLRLAKIALGFAILGLILVFLINFYTGLMVFTHYSGCDPLSSGEISAKDQLLPHYVMDVYGHIISVTGIFVAGIFAASLGTVASALNSLSAVTSEDILVNGFNIKIPPEKGALYAKWMSLGYGALSFALVFIVERLGGILEATLTLNGLVGGVTLGLFVLGIAFKRANTQGALYGALISLVLVIYVGVMAQIKKVEPEPLPLTMESCHCYINSTSDALKDPLDSILETFDTSSVFSAIFRISYMWYSMIGAMLTIILGLFISFISDTIDKYRLTTILRKSDQSTTSVVVITVNDITKSQQDIECSGVDNFALKIDDEKDMKTPQKTTLDHGMEKHRWTTIVG